MFGGLEVKGSVNGTKNGNKADSAPRHDEPATTQSAFSFLNSFSPASSGLSANVITEDTALSAFSFLYPATQAPSAEKATLEPIAVGSSFSFISSEKADVPKVDEGDAEVDAAPATSVSFLQQPVLLSSNVTIPEPDVFNSTANSETDPSPVSSSGFSFLVSAPLDINGTTNQGLPADRFLTTISGKALTNSIQETQAAGSGVSFINAATSKTAVKKKRTRTAVVGAMALQQQPVEILSSTASATSSVGDKAVQQQYSSSSFSINEDTTHKSALEASRRAEEFISEKIKKATMENLDEETIGPSVFKDLATIRSVDSDDPDGIIAAAKAAVEEAHKMESKSRNSSILSGLFRSRTSPPTSRHNSVSNLSGASPGGTSFRKTVLKTSSDEQNSIPQIPLSAAQRTYGGQSSTTSVIESERLRMEQELVQPSISTQRVSDVASSVSNLENPTAPEDYEHHGNPVAVVPVPLPPTHPSKLPTPCTSSVDILSVPSPPTLKDKCSEMISRFREDVVRVLQDIDVLRDHRRGLLEEQHVTAAKARLAEQQKAAAETQQMAAAEAEEFEIADEMSVVIEKFEREKAEYAIVLENIGSALNQFEAQKEECMNRITRCFNHIQHKLKEFRKETESLDTNDAMKKLEQFTAVSKVLSAENERLQQDWKHIERDASLVREERKEVEKAISLQSGEYEKARDSAKEKLTVVEVEIEELRKQLAAKQNVAAQLRTEVAGHEESILKVRVKFSRQLNRVQKKEMEIQDTQREWEMEKSNFDLQRQAHEQQMSTHSEALLERDQLLETLVHEIAVAGKFAEIIIENRGNFFDVLKCKDDFDGESGNKVTSLAQLQADVVKAEATKNEAQIVFKSASTILSNLEEEMRRLEKNLPLLEEMKKAAANRRDFKSAGLASKEIKEATARIKEIKEDILDDAKEKLASANLELVKRQTELQMAMELATEKEKQSGIKSMYIIAETLKRLFATKDVVCSNHAELKISRTPESDLTILSVGCIVLDEQIKALQLEGRALGEKINKDSSRWEDILREIAGASSGCIETSSMEPSYEETAKMPAEEETLPLVNSCSDDHNESVSVEDKFLRFLDLTERLKDVEDKLEQAVASDDFEEAAALDEILQKIVNDLAELDVTDEEVRVALSDRKSFVDQESFAIDGNSPGTDQEGNEHNLLPRPEAVNSVVESPTVDDHDSKEPATDCDNGVGVAPMENNCVGDPIAEDTLTTES